MTKVCNKCPVSLAVWRRAWNNCVKSVIGFVQFPGICVVDATCVQAFLLKTLKSVTGIRDENVTTMTVLTTFPWQFRHSVAYMLKDRTFILPRLGVRWVESRRQAFLDPTFPYYKKKWLGARQVTSSVNSYTVATYVMHESCTEAPTFIKQYTAIMYVAWTVSLLLSNWLLRSSYVVTKQLLVGIHCKK